MSYTLEELEERAEYIVETLDGMQPPHVAFYIESISYSAGRCIESFLEYERVRNDKISPDYLVSILQEAVGHAGALSKYFWPAPMKVKGRKKFKELILKRGEYLRKMFDLDESSPLYNRDLRNAWEHFDERLDDYLLNCDAGYFFPCCIIDDHTLSDDPTGHIFKLLDPKSECLVLMGQKFFFRPIWDEVNRIFGHLQKNQKP